MWEVKPRHLLLGDWATDPIRLADYSHTADVEAALVDVGDGAHASDYAGKDVRGKIVLADGVLARVQALAVAKYGAAGIVSDMPNQTTAWSGLDRTDCALGSPGGASADGIRVHDFAGDGGIVASSSAQWGSDHSAARK